MGRLVNGKHAKRIKGHFYGFAHIFDIDGIVNRIIDQKADQKQ